MRRENLKCLGIAIIAVNAWLVLAFIGRAKGQEPTAKADAVAVVEGVVREIFRSPRQGRIDVLVQVDVLRSEAGKPPRTGGRVTCPAPGDSVYVHLSQAIDTPNRMAVGPVNRAIPAELSQVRAYLVPRPQGGWEAISPEWFDLTSDLPAPRNSSEPAPATVEAAPMPNSAPSPSPTAPQGGKVVLTSLGLSADPLDVQGRFVLRVTSVERGGAAQRAGIEVGDVIAGANGAVLKDAAQFDQLSRRGGPMSLIVIDINSGKATQVEVTPVLANAGQPREPEPTPAPATPSRSLGIATETVSLGGRSALKVVRVDPESAGAKAGLEVGDVLVGANGASLTGPEQLAAALHKSGPSLTLQVRDVRTGRDTPVEVAFAGPQRPAPPIDVPALPGGPAPAPVGAPGASTNRLGVVTELSFFDVEVAVKVTEVEPGSPAARAGIQPGTIIVKADGKPMLHPNDLVEAARKATNSIRLTIADPRGSRTSDVNVDLRGR